MDLEKIRKFAESELQGYQIARAVTEVKNEVKDKEQGRDIVMGDYFKTLREPLLQQQKKSDEKQDNVIEQLRENQLALTDGFKDLIESNRDVITLNKELPQLEDADYLYLRCSLLSDSIISGKRSNVLYTFSTSTKTRSLPFEIQPMNRLWNKINKKTISEVTFFFSNDEDREVDLNRIDISLTVVLKEI